jgi:hypothetical protein
MADVNVSAMADQTLITVAIVRLHTIGLSEGIETSFSSELGGHKKKLSEEDAITQEQIFRVVYAAELKKKHDNELNDERRRVNYQEGKTPGRRGEIIMQDEINKETIRRYYLDQKKGSKLNSNIRFNLRI